MRERFHAIRLSLLVSMPSVAMCVIDGSTEFVAQVRKKINLMHFFSIGICGTGMFIYLIHEFIYHKKVRVSNMRDR